MFGRQVLQVKPDGVHQDANATAYALMHSCSGGKPGYLRRCPRTGALGVGLVQRGEHHFLILSRSYGGVCARRRICDSFRIWPGRRWKRR